MRVSCLTAETQRKSNELVHSDVHFYSWTVKKPEPTIHSGNQQVEGDSDMQLDWDRLWITYREEGYESLSDAQLVWLNVRSLIDSVNNGGIVSYFYNHNADNYDDAIDALETLDVPDISFVLVTIGQLFGDDVPSDIVERNEIISSWTSGGTQDEMMDQADKYLYARFEDLEARLDAYLIGNDLDPRTYI